MSGFSIKHPAWVAARLYRLGRKFDVGKTACEFCGREMWFTDFETIPEFLERAGEGSYESRKGRVATLDHVIPRKTGGPNHHMNYTPMCEDCNKDKGARDPLEWIAEREAAKTLARGRAKKFRKQVARAKNLMAKITHSRKQRKAIRDERENQADR